MNMIMPAEFERRMKEITEMTIGDAEDKHIEADKLMVEVLNSLGYESGTKIFEKMGKWYA